MAEFQEVMKQAKRMCETHTCGDCPLKTLEGYCRMCFPPDEIGDQKELEAIERIVMEWAEKNPEPRYPSWNEWHGANFQMAERAICAAHFMDAGDAGCYDLKNNCDKCRERPIPADIADKLGIKPIGGGER